MLQKRTERKPKFPLIDGKTLPRLEPNPDRLPARALAEEASVYLDRDFTRGEGW